MIGIDSVSISLEQRQQAWKALADFVKEDGAGRLEAMYQTIALADVPDAGAAILEGNIRGRTVVKIES